MESGIDKKTVIAKKSKRTIEQDNRAFWSWVLTNYDDDGGFVEKYQLPAEDLLLLGVNSGVLRKITSEYYLTERAKSVVGKLRSKEAILRAGIPISGRTWIYPPSEVFGEDTWYKYTYNNKSSCPSFIASRPLIISGNALNIKQRDTPEFVYPTTEMLKIIYDRMVKLDADITMDIRVTPKVYQRESLNGSGVVWFYDDDLQHRFAMQERLYDIVSCYWPRREFDAGYFVFVGDPSVFYCRSSASVKSVFPGRIGMACGVINVFEDNGWPRLEDSGLMGVNK